MEVTFGGLMAALAKFPAFSPSKYCTAFFRSELDTVSIATTKTTNIVNMDNTVTKANARFLRNLVSDERNATDNFMVLSS
jgi:hypothetical protein